MDTEAPHLVLTAGTQELGAPLDDIGVGEQLAASNINHVVSIKVDKTAVFAVSPKLASVDLGIQLAQDQLGTLLLIRYSDKQAIVALGADKDPALGEHTV